MHSPTTATTNKMQAPWHQSENVASRQDKISRHHVEEVANPWHGARHERSSRASVAAEPRPGGRDHAVRIRELLRRAILVEDEGLVLLLQNAHHRGVAEAFDVRV